MKQRKDRGLSHNAISGIHDLHIFETRFSLIGCAQPTISADQYTMATHSVDEPLPAFVHIISQREDCAPSCVRTKLRKEGILP